MNNVTKQQPALSRTEITQRVRGIVVDLLGIDQEWLRETSELQTDLRISRAGITALLLRIEYELQVTFHISDLERMLQAANGGGGTFGQLLDLIEGAVRAGGTR